MTIWHTNKSFVKLLYTISQYHFTSYLCRHNLKEWGNIIPFLWRMFLCSFVSFIHNHSSSIYTMAPDDQHYVKLPPIGMSKILYGQFELYLQPKLGIFGSCFFNKSWNYMLNLSYICNQIRYLRKLLIR